jgi:hypothetical protein
MLTPQRVRADPQCTTGHQRNAGTRHRAVLQAVGLVVSVSLRHGTAHASLGAVKDLEIVITKVRQCWPDVDIEVRAESGFGVPSMYAVCERLGVWYTFGIGLNPRLKAASNELKEQATRHYEPTRQKQRLFMAKTDRTGGWDRERTVIIKAEHHDAGTSRGDQSMCRRDRPPGRREHLELLVADLVGREQALTFDLLSQALCVNVGRCIPKDGKEQLRLTEALLAVDEKPLAHSLRDAPGWHGDGRAEEVRPGAGGVHQIHDVLPERGPTLLLPRVGPLKQRNDVLLAALDQLTDGGLGGMYEY